MEEPRTSTACFCLSQDPPTQDSETYAPDDMLCEDPDKKGSGHSDELVHGPEPDPFGFIQLPGNHIAIHNRPAPIARLSALGARPGRPHPKRQKGSRIGKESVSTCSSRWACENEKTQEGNREEQRKI